MFDEGKNVNFEKLTNFATTVFHQAAVPDEDAKIAARLLVATDLRGIDTHGFVTMAPIYVKRIRDGIVNPKPNIRVLSRATGTAVVDGDRGLGSVVGYRAMTEAMERAGKTGAGFVSVRNSSHYGAASVYAMLALPRNMIGISLTTGGVGMVVPGSMGTGAGVNVISIAAPTKEEAPFVLDMATTVAAGARLQFLKARGEPLPEGWAVDGDGKPITDSAKYGEGKGGGMLPLGATPEMGSYKGFGLSVTVEILCSILSGMPSIALRPNFGNRGLHFFGALRIDGFVPADDFKRDMDQMVRAFKALPKAPGVDSITLPGEIAHETESKRRRDGIPLSPAAITSLHKLAEQLDIKYDLD